MSIAITSWLRAYFALQEHAMDCRGVMEIRHGDDDVIRWPRTRGGDVVAIADLVDPYARAQPLRFGGHGLARRWRACVDELASCAVVSEYPYNRTFWPALAALCVYLHAQRAPLPAREVWAALFAQLSASRVHPTKEFHAGPDYSEDSL